MKRTVFLLSLVSSGYIFSMHEANPPVLVSVKNYDVKFVTVFYQQANGPVERLDVERNQIKQIPISMGQMITFRALGFKQKDVRILDNRSITLVHNQDKISVSQGNDIIASIKKNS